MPTEPIDIPIRTPGAGAASTAIRGVGASSLGAVVGVTALTGALAALTTVGIIKFAADYEEAMVGVAKTTGLGEGAITSLGSSFRKLSKEIPLSAREIAGIGEVAGQLGIQSVADIEAFTETVAKIASVTDFTSQQAGESMARLSNIFGLPIQNVNKLGSALNALENTTTANAPRIAEFTQRLSVASSQIGLSVADTAGLSATLVDLGFKAELAGTAVSKTFTEMTEDATGFADQLGVSTEEFKRRISEDAIGTITDWAAAIGSLPQDEMIRSFKEIGVEGARALSVFGALTKRTGLLSKNVVTSNEAFNKGTSLQEEFEVAVKATNAQLQLAKNDISDITIGIGEGLLPIVGEAIQEFRDWITSLNLTDDQLKNIGQFIGGSFVDLINGGANAVRIIRAGFDGLASGVLSFVSTIGLLAVPFANLTDAMGFTTDASDKVLTNLTAMSLASEELQQSMKTKFIEATKGPQALKVVIDEVEAGTEKLGTKGTANVKKFTEAVQGLKSITLEGQTFFGLSREEVEDQLKLMEQINDFGGVNTGNNSLTPGPDAFNPDTGNLIINERIQALIDEENAQKSVNDAVKKFGELNADLLKQTGLKGAFDSADINSMKEFQDFVDGFKDSVEALGFFSDPKDELAEVVAEIQRVGQAAGSSSIEIEEAVKRAKIKFGELKAEEDPLLDSLERIARGTESSITGAFVDAVKGMNTFQDAFKSTIDAIISEVIRLSVVRPLIEGLFGKPSGGSGGGLIGGLIQTGISAYFGGAGAAAGTAVSSGAVTSLPMAPSYAHGGSFIIPGSGGRDSQPVNFNGSPGERVTISPPGTNRNPSGGVNNSISITVNASGNDGEAKGGTTDMGFEIANVVKSIIVDMMRPGQPLGSVNKGRS